MTAGGGGSPPSPPPRRALSPPPPVFSLPGVDLMELGLRKKRAMAMRVQTMAMRSMESPPAGVPGPGRLPSWKKTFLIRFPRNLNRHEEMHSTDSRLWKEGYSGCRNMRKMGPLVGLYHPCSMTKWKNVQGGKPLTHFRKSKEEDPRSYFKAWNRHKKRMCRSRIHGMLSPPLSLQK